jgi:hypothetical protein
MDITGFFISEYCGYSISDYWWLLMAILLIIIDGYSIGGYWCLLLVIILMVISGYYINGY